MKLSALIKGGVKAIGNSTPIFKPMPVTQKANNGESVSTSYSQENLLCQMEPFRLDTVSDASNPAEINRINNMAWEFMQADGLTFPDAIRLAAEIAECWNVAACEAAYVDVMALWQRLKSGAV